MTDPLRKKLAAEETSKQGIFEALSKILIEEFEVDEQQLTLQSQLFTDLDLDSIDAVDLMVGLQELTGKKLSPEQFRQVRSVEDVVDAVASMVDA